jgi:hypothetical protein
MVGALSDYLTPKTLEGILFVGAWATIPLVLARSWALGRRRAIASINSIQEWYDETRNKDFSASSGSRRQRFYNLFTKSIELDAAVTNVPHNLQPNAYLLSHSLNKEISLYLPEEIERLNPYSHPS